MAEHKGFEGLEETFQNLANFGANMASCTRTAAWKLGGKIMTQAKRNCRTLFDHPTGRLMGSVTMKASFSNASVGLRDPATADDEVGKPGGPDITVVVGTKTNYAPFVEHGTRKMSAKPYLHPAFFANENDFEAILRDVVERKAALRNFNRRIPIFDQEGSWE